MKVIDAIERVFIEYEHRDFVRIVRELKPEKILEIGVNRGHGAERMIKALDGEVDYYGVDFFDKFSQNVILAKLTALGCRGIKLFKGDSREVLPMIVPGLPKMNFIYIDGGHSYDVCKSDWENVKPLLRPGTVVMFDDYLKSGTDVKRVVDEIKDCDVSLIESRRFWILHLPTKHIKAVVQ